MTTKLLRYFKLIYISSFLINKSPAEKDNTTEVVFGIVFNNKIPMDELPRNEAVVQILVDAANSNNNYGVSLRATAVQLICK